MSVLVRAHNMRWETSNDIPDYEYLRNWVIQTGEGTREDGSKFPIYYKVPKGEVGAFFTFGVEGVLHGLRDFEDRSYLEMFADQAIDVFKASSPVPLETGPVPVINTGLGLMSNQNYFLKSPIVPRHLQDLPKTQQFTRDTSGAAILLGQRLGVSPMKVEFLINDLFAGSGQNTQWMAGLVLDAGQYDPAAFGEAIPKNPQRTDWEKWTRNPLGRRISGSRDTAMQQRGWELYQTTIDEGQKFLAAFPSMGVSGIKLPLAPPTFNFEHIDTELELTPHERYEWQKIINTQAEDTVPMIDKALSHMENGKDKQERIRRYFSEFITKPAKQEFLRMIVDGTTMPTQKVRTIPGVADIPFIEEAAQPTRNIPLPERIARQGMRTVPERQDASDVLDKEAMMQMMMAR